MKLLGHVQEMSESIHAKIYGFCRKPLGHFRSAQFLSGLADKSLSGLTNEKISPGYFRGALFEKGVTLQDWSRQDRLAAYTGTKQHKTSRFAVSRAISL